MILLRRLLGGVLRRQRQRQGKTLREVSSAARVSLGYLSEVERGQKEPSSELLASICDALDMPISDVLREVSDDVALAEALEAAPAAGPLPAAVPVPAPAPLEAVPAGNGSESGPDAALTRSAAGGHQVSNVAA